MEETVKKPFLPGKKFELIFAVLIFILVVAFIIKLYQPTKTPVITKRIVKKEVVQKRSQDLGLISRGLTGKAIDVNTGRIITAARIFSLDDKIIYLELDLSNAPKGTIIDYIRYKEGRYVDHGELVLNKDNLANVLFNWTINSLLSKLRDGKWKIATYTNGILSKRILYQVVNNKVSWTNNENDISSGSSDYYLYKTLSYVRGKK